MIEDDPEAQAFDAALRCRAPGLDVRAERTADREFITTLLVHCSPLAALLPPALLQQQAQTQEASQRLGNPRAMRRIIFTPAGPIGRIAIDWRRPYHSYGVDIAVLPEARSTGAGLYMLRAWLDVADAYHMPCRLEVLRSNPAARLYARLGFAVIEPDDLGAPVATMERPAR
jgi:GNAT superfamily N-acetyltransferase